MKKWLGSWWKKEVAIFVAMGTVLGVVSACGIVPIGFELYFLIATVLLSVIISIVWNCISQVSSTHKSTLNLDDREGSRRSLTKKYEDKTHKFTYIFRQDLLDYSVANSVGRDFVSIRVLKGKNISSHVSDGLIYLECTEYKSHYSDIKIQAVDLKTGKNLRVEFIDRNEKDKYFEFPFKIYFATPLKNNEEFEIAFMINLLNELDVLKEDDEIMSISLSRYSKGVDSLEFNVCLNFEPTTVHVEHKKKNGEFELDNNFVEVEEYTPKSDIERMFNINWSGQPYIIRWRCEKPKYELYAINYRK